MLKLSTQLVAAEAGVSELHQLQSSLSVINASLEAECGRNLPQSELAASSQKQNTEYPPQFFSKFLSLTI